MNSSDGYLRPLYLQSFAADPNDRFGRIAGGRVYFSHAELIIKEGRERKVLPYADLANSSETAIQESLALIETPRPSVLGLDMAEPRIMGIVNVTPDSFSDGGEFGSTERAISHGKAMLDAGAAMLDIGGESTRPGSEPVNEDEELNRVLPVIDGLADPDVLISCDTRKANVMCAAVRAGASLVNDVSSLNYDRQARSVVAELGVPAILMHSKGEPKIMQDAPEYADVTLEVFDTLQADIAKCEAAGIPKSKIIADPGIGFGKTFDHNLELLDDLALFHGLGVPIMLGVSRKGFIGALSGVKEAGKRAVGSVSAALAGLSAGVQIFRVHDVQETAEAFAVWQGIVRQRLG